MLDQYKQHNKLVGTQLELFTEYASMLKVYEQQFPDKILVADYNRVLIQTIQGSEYKLHFHDTLTKLNREGRDRLRVEISITLLGKQVERTVISHDLNLRKGEDAKEIRQHVFCMQMIENYLRLKFEAKVCTNALKSKHVSQLYACIDTEV